MANLKEMTRSELKKYLSDNRNDNEAFSQGMGELLSRNRNTKRYPANISPEEIGKIIQEKIQQK
ncbi:DUF6887 family protein [Gloeothece verrucosa]|uniref:Uncharacterized protein n=1 Tax=Gloeothece verrucosa (strain PCC 7822) TaxID=497965 RepID=E0U711_GLOV7|nr:hypothetical protein [Gloeothece verrucosa]ADN17167.1 conserved hypothetical protein [Gloeothece verrucosa PCC 7822]